jgi:hypothetical protein
MARVRMLQNMTMQFSLLPQQVTIKGNKQKLQLAAVLAPQFGFDQAKIIASVKGHKQKVTYSSQMRKFIRKNSLQKSIFKDLETQLLVQLQQAKNSPQATLSILAAYLQNGKTPDCSVHFHPNKKG